MKIKKLRWKHLGNQRMTSYLHNGDSPLNDAFLFEITNHWWKDCEGNIKTGHKLTFLTGFGTPKILAVTPDLNLCIETAQGHFNAIIQTAMEE